MESKHKISIITVCFNTEKTIEKTIESVEKQRYGNFEYIIIDGGSTDGTLNLINKHKSSVDFLLSEKDNGIYDAMNKGIKQSTGEWLFFLNAGDLFVSEESLSYLINSSQDVSFVCGNIIRCYQKKKYKAISVNKSNPTTIDFLYNTLHHQATIIKRSMFDKYGLYDTNYKLCSDWAFFYKCIILHKEQMRYINADISYFQMDGASSIHGKQYFEEKTDFIIKNIGEDAYNLIVELDYYRRNIFTKYLYNIHNSLKNNPFLLNLKRKIDSCKKEILGKNIRK